MLGSGRTRSGYRIIDLDDHEARSGGIGSGKVYGRLPVGDIKALYSCANCSRESNGGEDRELHDILAGTLILSC